MPSIPTVMLVGGDPQFAYVIQRYAQSSGCRIIRVESINEVVSPEQMELPDLVLIGPAPNGVEGWQVLSDFRANPSTSSTPVFICSANETAIQGWEEYADGFLLMPVMYEDFTAALATITSISSDAARQQDSRTQGTIAPGGEVRIKS